MNVILFQSRFEQPILAGAKDCTIRKRRRDGRPRAKVGETVSLRVWTGKPYRSKQREFAQRTVKFTFPVRVSKIGIERLDMEPSRSRLTHKKMARALGFQGWREARRWYETTHGLPFDGELVHFPAANLGAPSAGAISPQELDVLMPAGSWHCERIGRGATKRPNSAARLSDERYETSSRMAHVEQLKRYGIHQTQRNNRDIVEA
jgi:hypothetical protein